MTMQRMPVAISVADTDELVAAEDGVIISVLQYTISAAGAVSVKFQSASDDLTGAMPMITGVPVSVEAPPVHGNAGACLFQTAPGEALNLNLSGATAVGGHMVIAKQSTPV